MDIESQVMGRYFDRTSESERQYTESMRWLPGGDTRTINHYSPYPLVLERGSGCFIKDIDGNQYLDFLNNYSALIHGHAHPAVSSAIARQAERGTALGAPSAVQAGHARLISERVRSVSQVRYCNSGTEATLFAIRAARAFTGKDLIVKVDGGYHGTHDVVEVNMFVSPHGQAPVGLPDSFPPVHAPAGVPVGTADQVLVVPFNDAAAVRYLFERYEGRIAALIVEPMLAAGGGIRPHDGYLLALRELASAHGVLLIFDEVATFRLGPLQNETGVEPDLTALGKIIGGGLPIGAFGGRQDIMMQFDPSREDPLYHSGTFCGNDITLAAGIAALEHYDEQEMRRLNSLGELLLESITAAAAGEGIKGAATGIGSYGHFHWGEGTVRDARDVYARTRNLGALPTLFHLEMLNRGVFMSRRSLLCLSTPMTREHVDSFLHAFTGTLRTLRPYIAAAHPNLLVPARAAHLVQ
ncbi:aspartate aminotransferase family protein [Streptomyces sp. NPDC053431]|uniref:aspartate aminotransferase family protein n=1 Tax=Streptomyces sp. NPDC053431 TaxID=3365703 RepID=UPI0037D82BB5